MREQLGEEFEGDEPSETLDSAGNTFREDLPTLRGAPDRLERPIRLEYNVVGELIRNLIKATLFAVFPASVMVTSTIALWALASVPPIRSAQSATYGAEADYHEALRGTEQVIGELTALGAPTREVEGVYFAFTDASGDETRELADIYLGVLADQLEVLGRGDEDTTAPVRRLLAPVVARRAETSVAYQVWVERVSTYRGRLAVALRAVKPPPAAMALYERPHPRAPEPAAR